MALPASFIDELLYRCNIIDVVSQYVRLKKAGANYVGLCPFHSEKTPSFMVSAEKQIFKCFGCGEGGNVISFIMKIENLSFIDAVKKLAESCGMTVPDDNDASFPLRKRISELNRAAAKYFYETLVSERGKPAMEYLLKRGLSPKNITAFGLGYADSSWDGLLKAMTDKGFTLSELESARLIAKGKNGGYYNFFRERVMFPIIDVRGDVIAFSGRVLTSGAEGRKYVNSPDTPVYSKSRALFGINLAKKTKSDFLLLVEGNMDVVSLHGAGFDNAIATCGTALTPQQAQLMSKYAQKVVVCFDQDAAGKKATDKAIEILTAAGLDVKILRLPPRKNERGELLLDEGGKPLKDDPDSFIKRAGADAFRNLLTATPSDTEYRLSSIKAAADLSTDEGKIAYLKETAGFLASMPSDIEREIYTRNVAQSAGLSEKALLSEVARIREMRLREKKKKIQREGATVAAATQPQDKLVRYENPACAKCEERFLFIALSDRDLFSAARTLLPPECFSSALLRGIYEKALVRADENAEISAAALLIGLEDAEVKHLSAVLSSGIPSGDPNAEMKACAEKILTEHKKREGGGDPLANALAKKRNRGM